MNKDLLYGLRELRITTSRLHAENKIANNYLYVISRFAVSSTDLIIKDAKGWQEIVTAEWNYLSQTFSNKPKEIQSIWDLVDGRIKALKKDSKDAD